LIFFRHCDKLKRLVYEEDIRMGIALKIVLALASVILIVTILLQSSNSAGLSGSIAGGAEQLFGKKKSQGYDAILSKISAVTAVLFIILSLVLVAIE
jgi:preprotein translocase subunit SecG